MLRLWDCCNPSPKTLAGVLAMGSSGVRSLESGVCELAMDRLDPLPKTAGAQCGESAMDRLDPSTIGAGAECNESAMD